MFKRGRAVWGPLRIWLRERPIRIEKEPSKYDAFVLDFLGRLPPGTRYAIVSGYTAILFGRERQTEDIDMLVAPMPRAAFLRFWDALAPDFWCLNAATAESAFDEYLQERLALRFAYRGTIETNMEFKFAKQEMDDYAIREARRVLLNGATVQVGPFELQVAYKLMMGSDKDIEDARHLYGAAREVLDQEELSIWLERLKVKRDRIRRAGIAHER